MPNLTQNTHKDKIENSDRCQYQSNTDSLGLIFNKQKCDKCPEMERRIQDISDEFDQMLTQKDTKIDDLKNHLSKVSTFIPYIIVW
jgi:hypothetical protein